MGATSRHFISRTRTVALAAIRGPPTLHDHEKRLQALFYWPGLGAELEQSSGICEYVAQLAHTHPVERSVGGRKTGWYFSCLRIGVAGPIENKILLVVEHLHSK